MIDSAQRVSDAADRLLEMLNSSVTAVVHNPIRVVAAEAVIQAMVRGYLGGVITVRECAVGSLCAVTDNPRIWTSSEIARINKDSEEVSKILEGALGRSRQ